MCGGRRSGRGGEVHLPIRPPACRYNSNLAARVERTIEEAAAAVAAAAVAAAAVAAEGLASPRLRPRPLFWDVSSLRRRSNSNNNNNNNPNSRTSRCWRNIKPAALLPRLLYPSPPETRLWLRRRRNRARARARARPGARPGARAKASASATCHLHRMTWDQPAAVRGLRQSSGRRRGWRPWRRAVRVVGVRVVGVTSHLEGMKMGTRRRPVVDRRGRRGGAQRNSPALSKPSLLPRRRLRRSEEEEWEGEAVTMMGARVMARVHHAPGLGRQVRDQ